MPRAKTVPESPPTGGTPRRVLIQNRDIPNETPDDTPKHIPGLEKPLTLREEMRRFVKEELSRVARENDDPTFEEEDDFDEDDPDADLLSPYTVHELTPEEGDIPDDLEGNPEIDKEPQSPPAEPPLAPAGSGDALPAPTSNEAPENSDHT
jgi:hypothetical protein